MPNGARLASPYPHLVYLHPCLGWEWEGISDAFRMRSEMHSECAWEDIFPGGIVLRRKIFGALGEK